MTRQHIPKRGTDHIISSLFECDVKGALENLLKRERDMKGDEIESEKMDYR